MLTAYGDVPQFVAGTPVSGIDVERLRQNAHILWQTAVTWPSPVAFQDIDWRMQGATGNQNSGITGVQWYRIYHGAFQFHQGMEKFRFEMYYNIDGSTPHNDTMKVYINTNNNTNWVLLETITLVKNTSGYGGWEYDITGYGFQENDIVQIQIDYQRANGAAPGNGINSKIAFTGVFVYPLVNPDTWPGIPFFDGPNALSEANLNQLSNASDWIYRKLLLQPQLPITSILANTMSFTRDADSTVYWAYPDQSMWQGYAVSANGHNKFKIGGYALYKDGQERYILYRNNVAVDYWPSSTTFSTPYSGMWWELEDTLPDNGVAFYRIGNKMVSNTGDADTPDGRGRTRHNFDIQHMERTTDYPVLTSLWPINDKLSSKQSMTYAQLLDYLNGIGNALYKTKDWIDTNPLMFGRAYIIRPILAGRPEDNQYHKFWSITKFEKRRGNKLWVRGKGVKLLYGPVTVDNKDNHFEYKFLYEKDVTAGDKMESTYVYLDSFEGLFPGMPYFVRADGELLYAAEGLV